MEVKPLLSAEVVASTNGQNGELNAFRTVFAALYGLLVLAAAATEADREAAAHHEALAELAVVVERPHREVGAVDAERLDRGRSVAALGRWQI